LHLAEPASPRVAPTAQSPAGLRGGGSDRPCASPPRRLAARVNTVDLLRSVRAHTTSRWREERRARDWPRGPAGIVALGTFVLIRSVTAVVARRTDRVELQCCAVVGIGLLSVASMCADGRWLA
jgi:hypothetical protein